MRKRYPNYKPSGVEWLGEVPERWHVTRLSRVVACLDGRRVPLNREERSERQGPYPYWGANGIVDRINEWLFDEPLVLLGEDGAPFFAVNKEVAFFLTGKIWVNNHAHVLRPAPGVNGEFLTHALNQTEYGAFIDGSTRDKLTQDDMGSIPVAMPPPDDQCAIANFLDRETEKIDTLIAKKRALIERLKEKRTALISRTVTRGLPPDAARAAGLDPHPKLKSSGIDWLGHVPTHWEAAQLRRFVSFITSGSRGWAEHYADSGSVFVRIGNLTRDSIRLDLREIQYVDPPPGTEGERTRIQTGDLLFSITAYLGSVAVAPPSLLNGYINQHIALVRVNKMQLVPEFTAYAALSDVGQSQLNGQAYGGTKVQLALDDVKSLWLPVPPLSEQRAIADYLDRETAKIDRMVAKVETAIARLREYRTALITAAVTGKIDVREALGRGESARTQA